MGNFLDKQLLYPDSDYYLYDIPLSNLIYVSSLSTSSRFLKSIKCDSDGHIVVRVYFRRGESDQALLAHEQQLKGVCFV
jgi:hypothetical protein